MDKIQSFDYVVVGSGTSGSVLATRLALNSKCSVLLIEAGGRSKGMWFKIPLGIGKVLHNKRYIWKFFTKKSKNLDSRKIYLPQGKILGGSSTINGLVFFRGIAQKFDEISKSGCKGWSYKEVLPYFKKFENFEKNRTERGQDGPVNISEVSPKDILSEAFKNACLKIGIKFNKDYNSLLSEGVSYLQLNTKRGKRVNIFDVYYKLVKRKRNFNLLYNTIVKKIVLKGKKAVGVEIIKNNRQMKIFANKEVIISCGAIQTPKLLELSGIGNPKILKKNSIPVLHKLNGVGENLIDHYTIRLSYESKNIITLNDLLAKRIKAIKIIFQYLFFRNGLLSTPSATIQAILKSKQELEYPDLKIQLVHLTEKGRFGIAYDSQTDIFSGFSLSCYQLFPRSKGSTHISSNDVNKETIIDPNYLDDDDDMNKILKAIKIARKISLQSPLKELIVEEIKPGLNLNQKDELIKFIKNYGQTSYHPIGTCKMGNCEESVVDSDLKVKGLDNLRIVDASILPFHVSANTHAQCLMIAEKAADLILSTKKY